MAQQRLEDPCRVIPEDEIARTSRCIAKILKDRREALGLSKTALSQKSGVSIQAVAFIESAVNSPSVSTLLRLCSALEITPEAVFKEARMIV